MGEFRHPWLVMGKLVLLAAAGAVCLQDPSAQVVDDSVCPRHALDIAACATCDADRRTPPIPICRSGGDRALRAAQP